MTMIRVVLIVAGAFGACGTALLAAGNHAAGGLATTAGQMLLWHAPALIAVTLARDGGYLRPAIGSLALAALIAGVSLFSGDLAVRAFLGWSRLFPMAAPAGGMLIMAGWLALAVAAFVGGRDKS